MLRLIGAFVSFLSEFCSIKVLLSILFRLWLSRWNKMVKVVVDNAEMLR
ncbi:hypothetical protein ACQ4OC_11555 [Yersinia sp. J1]|nr:hypothetical protein [Yersinia entomophaga]